jgi:hypothetical protein
LAIVVCWSARKRAPAVSFGIMWCAVALFPVSNVLLPTGIVLAERTLFLPSVGVVVAGAGLVQMLMANAAQARRVNARGIAVLCGIIVVAGVARSVERQRVWRNEGFYVGRGIKDAPRSFRLQRAFGDMLLEAGQPQMAHDAYDRALAFAPTSVVWRVHNEIASTLIRRGDDAAAVEQLRASLSQLARQEYERGELVVAELSLGRYEAAKADADSAVVYGANAKIFRELGNVADSAMRVGAPAGSIKIMLGAGPVARVR